MTAAEHSVDVLTDGRWVPVNGILRYQGEHLAPPATGCGIEKGYYQHRRNSEDPCEPCREAHARAGVRRYQRRKQRQQVAA